ncbi:MAG TPA: transposase family protein [Nitrososphaeraceae archaeon]|nr:transposase family protein [Nitrososphaeraceae archaeon]
MDATEQEIQRPAKDKMRKRKITIQARKKKRHTVKTQLMVKKEGKILYKSNHHYKKGRKHDYTVYKKEQPQKHHHK